MPQGLQVWDAAGNLILDTSVDVGRVIGTLPVNANSAGFQDITVLNAGEKLWAVLMAVGANGQNKIWVEVPGAAQTDNVNGTRIRWNVVNAGTILYGVY